MQKIEPFRYSAIQIALHWVTAALVLCQLFFGERVSAVIEAVEAGGSAMPTDQALVGAHYRVGISILALVAVRILVRLCSARPLLQTPATLMNKAALATQIAFYVLLVAMPTTGLLSTYFGDPWGEFHSFAEPVLVVLIALHAASALFQQFRLKDSTLRRMLVPN